MTDTLGKSSTEDEPQTLTMSVPRAAKIAGIGRDQAYAAARRGDIPSIRLGGRLLVLSVPFMKKLRGE